MPLYRFECSRCETEIVDLVKQANAGPPEHCGAAMRRLLPRRVVGRCRPDTNGVHAGSGFAPAATTPATTPASADSLDYREQLTKSGIELLGDPSTETWRPENDPPGVVVADPSAMPAPPTGGAWAKDFDDCTAEERDARWRDSAEALAAWKVQQHERLGATLPAGAHAEASQDAQRLIEHTRADVDRSGAPT